MRAPKRNPTDEKAFEMLYEQLHEVIRHTEVKIIFFDKSLFE